MTDLPDSEQSKPTNTTGQWTPTADRVLLRLDAPEEKVTAGGIVLPGRVDSREKVKRGAVEAVGPKVREVSVGDRVVVSGYAGSSVPDDEHARIIAEADVLVVEASND